MNSQIKARVNTGLLLKHASEICMGARDLHAKIIVGGIVQGVGFRPFIYHTALKYGLKGYVRNIGDARVEIVIEGAKKP